MCSVDDGYIQGHTVPGLRQCWRCGRSTLVIEVENTTFDGFTVAATILHDRTTDKAAPKSIRFIGVGCGCYAKLHRQIANIKGRR